MTRLTLADLERFLIWLLGEGLELLRASQTGLRYEGRLRRQLGEAAGLPEAIRSRYLSGELGASDDRYDQLGGAIWWLTGGLIMLPLLDEQHRQLALAIRQQMMPSLDKLRESYEDEANAAHGQRKFVTENEARLQAWPVAPDLTMYGLLDAFVKSGEEIGRLLGQRAAKELEGRARASTLRVEIIGTFTRLREGLRDELEDDPALPRDLSDKLFAALDQTATNRERRGAASASEDAAPVPVAVPEPVVEG